MSSPKFSDKLIIIGQKYVIESMKHPNIVPLFVTGENQNEPKNGVAMYWRANMHLNDPLFELIETRAKKAKTPEEKTFYERAGAKLHEVVDEMDEDFIRRFGKVPDQLLAEPMKKSTSDYHDNMQAMKTMDEFAIYLFAAFWIFNEMGLAMRRHPKFKPNACFDWSFARDYSAYMKDVRSLVDSIGARVSVGEQTRLTEIYCKCLHHEIGLSDFDCV